MPRITAALAIAAALIIGVFIIKNKQTAAPTTSLIAEQIQNANQSSLEAYQQELEESGAASDTALVIPTPTYDVATTTTAPLAPPTATDELAQNILETYVNAKESGVNISSDVATQIADNALAQPYTDSSSAKTYSTTDLTIEANSSQDMKNYGNALGRAFSVTLPAGGEDELTIFSDFAATNDESVLPKLNENIVRYQKIISAILAIPVPENFAETDLNLVNSLSRVVYDVQKMRDFPSDPVGGQNAAEDYQTAITSVGTVFSEEKTLFTANNIVFSTAEPGYFLTE